MIKSNPFKALIFIIPIIFFGCEDGLIKKAQTPTYLSVNEFSLVDNPDLNEGSLDHKINAVWVFVNDDIQGVYELPATFPVLTEREGQHIVTLRAGVKNNGISATRVDYPFYASYDTSINFIKGDTNTLTPAVQYFDELQVWEESFEDAGVAFESGFESETGISKTNAKEEIYDKKGAGKIFLEKGMSRVIVQTVKDFVLPTTGESVFVEFNYKTEALLNVGVIAQYTSGAKIEASILWVKPNEEWNKMYVDLVELIRQYNAESIDSYKIYFKVLRDSVEAEEEATVLLDNIKLVHR